MPDIRYIDKDFVRFKFSGLGGNEEQAILAFGDKVEVLEEGGRKRRPVASGPWSSSTGPWRERSRGSRFEGATREC